MILPSSKAGRLVGLRIPEVEVIQLFTVPPSPAPRKEGTCSDPAIPCGNTLHRRQYWLKMN